MCWWFVLSVGRRVWRRVLPFRSRLLWLGVLRGHAQRRRRLLRNGDHGLWYQLLCCWPDMSGAGFCGSALCGFVVLRLCRLETCDVTWVLTLSPPATTIKHHLQTKTKTERHLLCRRRLWHDLLSSRFHVRARQRLHKRVGAVAAAAVAVGGPPPLREDRGRPPPLRRGRRIAYI
jgi:hypothetical protein